MRTIAKNAVFLVSLLSSPLFGQSTQNTTIQPDCIIPFTFTAAGNFPATPTNNGPGDNRQKGCAAWTLMYQNSGMTSVSVTLQSGASVNTTVTFGSFAGTVSAGFANPIVSDTGGSLQAKNGTADISWVRVNVAATGAGTLNGILYGFRNSSAAVAGGGTPCTSTALSLQYNNAGAFGCITNWTSDGTNVILTAIAAPATPAAGKGVIYEDSTSKNLAIKDDAGVVKHGVQTQTCTNQFVTAISDPGAVTCTTDVLASAQHANQGTTTTLLHGDAAGNPSWGQVVSGDLNITPTTCGAGAFVNAISSAAAGTCATPATGTDMCSDMFNTPGAITIDTSAGSVNCIVVSGTYTVTAAIAISAANVSVVCLTPGVILQQTTAATNLFTLSGTGPITITGCALDKNSATGGAWVSSSASKLVLKDNTFQNGGTNSDAGLIAVSGGTDVTIQGNKFPGNPTDRVLMVSSSGADITALHIDDNYFTMNSAADTVIYINGGANTLYGGTISRNQIYPTGSCMRTNLQTTVPQRLEIFGNNCQLQGAISLEGYAIYGLRYSGFYGNVFADNNQAMSNKQAFAIHDTHYSSIIGNQAYLFNSGSHCLQALDSNYTVFSGNSCYGGRTTDGVGSFEIGIGAPGSSVSGNIIDSNVVVLQASSAAACFRIAIGAAAGDTANSVKITNNSCFGDNTASSDGILLSTASGAVFDRAYVAGNTFDDVATGISVGSGVTNTQIGKNVFRSVNTLWSDSATNTHFDPQCNTWNMANSTTNLAVSVDGGAATNTAKAAATTQSITLFTLSPLMRVTSFTAKTSTVFAGTTTLTSTIGDSVGTTTSYSSTTYDLMAAVSNTNFQDSGAGGITLPKHVTQAGSNVLIGLISTGANISSISQGSVDYRICYDAP